MCTVSEEYGNPVLMRHATPARAYFQQHMNNCQLSTVNYQLSHHLTVRRGLNPAPTDTAPYGFSNEEIIYMKNLYTNPAYEPGLINYVQKQYHSGRTDVNGGHRDALNRNNLGGYHFHHGTASHTPCCRTFSPQGESIIDLFKMYGASVTTELQTFDGRTTYLFAAVLMFDENRSFLLFQFPDRTYEGFSVVIGGARQLVESFFNAALNPCFVYRADSPWVGVGNQGFDYLVDEETFHDIMGKHTGLPRPVPTLSRMMENVFRNVTLGESDIRRSTMVITGQYLLDNNYYPAFVAGMLANIEGEGNFGEFEGAGNQVYMQYFINNYNYNDRFSRRHIYTDSNSPAIYNTLQEIYDMAVSSDQINMFGLGAIQRTNRLRLLPLIQTYGKIAGGMDRQITSRLQVIEAENDLLIKELRGEETGGQGTGSHVGGGDVPWGSNLLNVWKTRNQFHLASETAARNAGFMISQAFIRPRDPNDIIAHESAKNAESIYRVMIQ
jgi:hypothetical protein